MEYDIGDNICQEDIPNNGPKGDFKGEYVCKFHISIADKRYMIFVLNVYNGNKRYTRTRTVQRRVILEI